MKIKLGFVISIFALNLTLAQNNHIYKSKAFTIFPDKVVQDTFNAKVVSSIELMSNYRSPEFDKYSPNIQFKFSINSRDNEMPSGKDHHVTLNPINGKCITTVVFGEQLTETKVIPAGINLPENTIWTIRLDMRKMLNSFEKTGFYTFYNGDKLAKADFRGVYIAGNAAPLSWDFSNLYNKHGLQLNDPDGDGIYETTLIMNKKQDIKSTEDRWNLTKDISAFPQYKSDFPISDAIYNLTTEEMIKAVEPDSTFRTGKEWAGVWTRDISYSIILSMAYLQPKVAEYSLLRKVKNNLIIQDTGTGGAYPVSTDRMIWAVAAWELYKATGNMDWLRQAYGIIKKSIEADIVNAYDTETGLVKGESSFLDWREQTYPRWMQPADIYESECLGTNAVHYQANIILSKMAKILNDEEVAVRHSKIAEHIKEGINKYLWLEDKGYYAQYLYGRNFKSVSSRSEALGEALCVIFGISNAERSKKIVSSVPVTDYGISCIYPQIPNIPPYHNNGVWPFVQAYWALASAQAGNEQSVLESIAAIYRPAALFLTNKENFVAETGDFAGTQINSSNMLWSLSGNLALVHKILFGVKFDDDSLRFQPLVPKALSGTRTLTNFKVRNSILNIELSGYGNRIVDFEIDGKKSATAAISYLLSGTHSVKIVLDNKDLNVEPINKTSNYTSVETPLGSYSNKSLTWSQIENAVSYTILRNGKLWKKTAKTKLKVPNNGYSEYQIIAIDKNKVPSFASEPIIVYDKRNEKTIELEDYIQQSDNKYNNYQGKGYVETNNSVNTNITLPFSANKSGVYTLKFRYANGNGPVNTENKCAIRSLKVDGSTAGTTVFPQRGANEWSNWGYTNSIQIKLSKGKHLFEINLETENENMNTEINQALIDAMIIYRVK